MTDITGATALELAPTSADDLVSQLNEAAGVRAWWPLLLLIPVLGWAAAYWLRLKQRAKRSVVVFYEVEDSAGQWFAQLVETWGAFSQSAGLWRMTSQGSLNTTHQRKVNAGASTLVNRVAAAVSLHGPRVLVTNIAVPSVQADRQSLHFLPDRLLVQAGRHFSEVSYAQLTVHCVQTRFIEHGRVPRDATRVGTTWKYANIGGGPDRRYNNNKELPILGYAEVELTTPSRLQWTLQCSNLAAAKTTAAVLSRAQAPALAQGPVSPPATQLLSDAERERASELLRAAYLEGRLTEPEYEERSGMALKARRQSELDACLEGMPAAPPVRPRGVSPSPAPASSASQAGARRSYRSLPNQRSKETAPTPPESLRRAGRTPSMIHPVFLWLSLLPFGFGCWAALYACTKVTRPRAAIASWVAVSLFVAGIVFLALSPTNKTSPLTTVAVLSWLASWVISASAWVAVRSDYARTRAGSRNR